MPLHNSLLSSMARIQAPWVKVTIGNYTFGIFSKSDARTITENGFYSAYNVQYPNYVQTLQIQKINGQVNTYSLSISYPVRVEDDPNFFEKVFSSVSSSRRIVFSYGDSMMPEYCYKEEEAIITGIQQTFNMSGTFQSVINYNITAVSSATLSSVGSFTFLTSGAIKPSDEIKKIFRNSKYGLKDIFTGMNEGNIDALIAGDDKEVEIESKTNISPLDYIKYLVENMVPQGSTKNNINKDIYVLTIHDDVIYDKLFADTVATGGPYFKVTRTSYEQDHSEAYEIDVGYNNSTIVSNFTIDKNENYSIYFDYASELYPNEYVRRVNRFGEYEEVYAPTSTSKNEMRKTRAEDSSWFTKLTKYPIGASITIQGLLRPATLMNYVRLNVIFPGGNKHISSGLYIITKQKDDIGPNGYKTTLNMTRINS